MATPLAAPTPPPAPPASPAPIVYALPDMSIQVFSQTFHVNSSILKVHSAYFRTFLDSPDKVSQSDPDSEFKYEWVTHVDSDGKNWSITAKEKALPEAQNEPFVGDEQLQIVAFTALLSALNCLPMEIQNARQLCLVTEMADYCRVLPVVSNALYSAIFGNTRFVADIPENSIALLEAALKLRNKPLFRDCFIHVLGPSNEPRCLDLENEDLKELCRAAFMQLIHDLNVLHSEILELELADCDGFATAVFNVKKSKPTSFINSDRNMIKPYYYRAIYEVVPKKPKTGTKIRDSFAKLLANKLVLDRTKYLQSEEGKYTNSFLHFELADEDFPWDDSERSW
ncbi:hypothetical protein LSUE1_G004186 [Lachnellula suecica]|uniref:BTB domain-containing protein n=1 Tax=Lachnellula suecica TaxID=602035 RepID=A0A8T9C2I4_9HELO|nr:hypothetical protein LSUE1_G004186 [Lachnellula suecica]